MLILHEQIMNWPVFFKRLGTAVFFCAVLMAALLTNFETHLIVVLVIQFFCIKEFIALFQKIYPKAFFPKWLPWITQFGAVVISVAIAMASAIHEYIFSTLLIPIIIFMYCVLQKKTALLAAMICNLAFIYIALPMGFLMSLFIQFKSNILEANIPLALVLLIWTNDTMAYITGSFIGKTPFSSISPKKTWEGIIGGVVFTVIAVAIIHNLQWIPSLRFQDWVAFALCASLIGTCGDLIESKLKRLAGVKDSGNILPGHGGALDRFDSLLLALPFAFCYAMTYMSSSMPV